MIIPALVFYAIFSGDALGVIGGIIVALFIPMLATALASIVGYAVAQIARLFRRSNFVTLLVSLVFLGAYFWFVTNILPNSDALILWLEGMDVGALAKNMPLLYMIGNASLLSPISLAFVVAVSTIVATAVYLVISKNYNKIITSSKGTKNAVYKEKKLVKGSVLSALVKRELCHFTSSAGYMLNTALGLVFEVVLAVVAVVKRQQLSEIFVQGEIGGGVAVKNANNAFGK